MKAIHLQYFDHGDEFTEVLNRFEDSELASAYLDGYEAAERALLPPVELKETPISPVWKRYFERE